MALGSLTLLAGREGIGKSTISYTLVAWIARGTMKGRFYGEPRSVLVAATEDSWKHTIVPRLMAAGADLAKVFQIEVKTEEGFDGQLNLPVDLNALYERVRQTDAVLLILDPLLSRLDASLDSHKDADVRIALEPLTAFADRAGIAVLGIIHVNKSNSGDALNSIMGSRAFGAVARAVLMAVRNPEDGTLTFGLAKNNLGPKDQTAYHYRIVGERVAETPDGDVWTGKVDWLGDADRSVDEVVQAISEGSGGTTSATGEASVWLDEYLQANNGEKESRIIVEEARREGHSSSALRRARERLGIVVSYVGTKGPNGPQRRSIWALPK